MSTKEIIEGIKSLPFNERLFVIEKAIKTLHDSNNHLLEEAATALYGDYKNDKDLTALTALDFENFYKAK